MIGNVNGIVDSMFAADNMRNRQNTADTKTGISFSDYLDYALLNSRSGALFGSGIGSDYSYMNGLSGSVWQAFALKALVEGLQKNSQSSGAVESQQVNGSSTAPLTEEKKPDWARIRVIRRYEAPMAQEKLASRGILA